MAAHIWWITRVSSMRFSCSGWARTLHISRSNKWSIGLKLRLLQAIWFFARCLLQALQVIVLLATWHDALSRANIIAILARIWRRKTDRMTPFRDLIAVMFPWMVTLGVFVCVLLCLFSPYLMFFIIDNQLGIPSYQIRELPCRARGARAHNLCSYLPFCMFCFVHGNVLFLSVIR